MDFSGWEKLSLLDFDHHLSTTLFVAGCDLRCPFCHNASLVLSPDKAPTIPWSDIVSYLLKRQGVLDSVCVTGGEPTLMPDLSDKLKEIKSLGYLVKLDTNGSRPKVLKDLFSRNLVDYVAMDIKNSPDKYSEICGVSLPISLYEESVSLIMASGVPYEFRTTAMEEFHSLEDFRLIAEWIEGAERYYIQKYVDRDGCIAHGFHPLSKEKALEARAIVSQTTQYAALRGYDL